MLKVNDKINSSSETDMTKLKEAGLNSEWIVTNRKRTIIKFIGDENQANHFFKQQRVKRGGAFLLEPLVTITITKEKQKKYLEIGKLINANW